MSYVATLANWDALLQEDYVQGQIVSAINIATPFRDTLKRGRHGRAALRAGVRRQGRRLAGSGGARAEGAQMPQYGAGEYQDVTLKARYNYAPFKITGQSEEFGTRKAFVEFAMQILKDTKEGLRLFTGRQCWADGQGNLALVNGALLAGAGTVVCDSAYGVLWGSLATNTTFLIKRKMAVQFGSEDNSGQGYQVTGVGSTSFTISPPLQNNVADNLHDHGVGLGESRDRRPHDRRRHGRVHDDARARVDRVPRHQPDELPGVGGQRREHRGRALARRDSATCATRSTSGPTTKRAISSSLLHGDGRGLRGAPAAGPAVRPGHPP